MPSDPILLPDSPELRARAEAVARDRHGRFAMQTRMGELLSWDGGPIDVRAMLVDAALAELRDLSTPAGRDHACRWLWELLTGGAPEWCPVWQRKSVLYRLVGTGAIRIVFVPPADATVLAVLADDGPVLVVPGIASLSPAEALAAAIVAALEWRRGRDTPTQTEPSNV